MRVERCQGASCVGFGFRGNSTELQFVGSGAPQAEYLDAATYGTIYRYRVRMENSDGVSAWSTTIEIDSTVQGTSACDTGTIADLTEELQVEAGLAIVEHTSDRVEVQAGIAIVEYYDDVETPAQQPRVFAGIGIVEYYDDTSAPQQQPQIMAGIAIVEYYDGEDETTEPPPTDPNDPGPFDDGHCLCPQLGEH